jgi:hypothetical protein
VSCPKYFWIQLHAEELGSQHKNFLPHYVAMARLLRRVRSSSASRVGKEEHLKVPEEINSRKRSISLKPLKPQFLKKGDRKKHTTSEQRLSMKADSEVTQSKKSIKADNEVTQRKKTSAVSNNDKPKQDDSNKISTSEKTKQDDSNKSKKEKKKICKFKDDSLNEDYQLIPTKARKAPFGRCYFARHRESKKIVLIAMIFQHVFDQFQGDCGEDELHSIMKDADPNLRGLREKIQCAGAVALVMDISMKYSKNDMKSAKDIKASAPEQKLEEEPAKPASSVLDTKEDDTTAAGSPEPDESVASFGSWLNSWFSPLEGGQETKKEIKSAHYQEEVCSVASIQDTTNGSLDNAQKYKSSDHKVMTLEVIEESIEEPTEETSSSIHSTDALKGEKYIPVEIDEAEGEPNKQQQPLNQVRAGAESREEKESSHSRASSSSAERSEALGERGRPPSRDKARFRKPSSVTAAVADIEERQQPSHSRVVEDDSTIFSADYSIVRLKQRLTVWKLVSSLEMADCMPLAVFDESFDDADSSDDLFSVQEYDDNDQYA